MTLAKVLETIGMVCPFPLVEAKQAIQEIQIGEELIIHFDCTQATESIPLWAAKEGHEVTEFEQVDDAQWKIVVKRGK
jgi:TusA-related sulfurtransferase